MSGFVPFNAATSIPLDLVNPLHWNEPWLLGLCRSELVPCAALKGSVTVLALDLKLL